jgi:CMP-N-acetylneuraminic acid synthetase
MARSVSAIVPMRHTSERVPGKNYRLLGDRPLFHHVVASLLEVPSVGEVVIDTDSDVILEYAERVFPSVLLVRRPEHLTDGHLSMNLVLENTARHCSDDVLLQTHSTNPFVRPETFQRAIDAYFDEECDSVFGATRIQGRLWSAQTEPINHDPSVLARTQDLDPVYLENSCVYVFSKETLAQTGNRLGQRPHLLEIDSLEALDIDVEDDFTLAEMVHAAGLTGSARA